MIKILMLGGTGVIGQSILSVIGDNPNYSISVTSRSERKSDFSNVRYICGNANDLAFINQFEDGSYDVLIDFMNYRNENLERNVRKVLSIANQYIFLSSARVYDNSQSIIDESCTLLLNTTEDMDFKTSGTYAVKKAYQEEFVKKNGGDKVTIIRPYKTYYSDRLQLGEYEIKHWLLRLLYNKPIVINRNMLTRFTSLTSGVDVANGIVSLINKKEAFGETFQIVTDESMTWNDVLTLYTEELRKYGVSPTIYLSDSTNAIDVLFEDGYHMPYDILFNRRFSSKKIARINNIAYQGMENGLRNAISQFLERFEKKQFSQTMYDDIVDEFIKNNDLPLWGC